MSSSAKADDPIFRDSSALMQVGDGASSFPYFCERTFAPQSCANATVSDVQPSPTPCRSSPKTMAGPIGSFAAMREPAAGKSVGKCGLHERLRMPRSLGASNLDAFIGTSHSRVFFHRFSSMDLQRSLALNRGAPISVALQTARIGAMRHGCPERCDECFG